MLGGWGGNRGPGGKQWQPTAGFMASVTWADCRGPGSPLELYARFEYGTTFTF